MILLIARQKENRIPTTQTIAFQLDEIDRSNKKGVQNYYIELFSQYTEKLYGGLHVLR